MGYITADDPARLIESLDLRDAILVGHSTGGSEVARYIGRHHTERVATTVLPGAVPPLMLRTDANPEGLPIEAFDAIRAGVDGDRSQYYREPAEPFCGFNRPGAEGQRRPYAAPSGRTACRSGSRAPTTASRSSQSRTSPALFGHTPVARMRPHRRRATSTTSTSSVTCAGRKRGA
ncbi:hypothetical protein DIZ27_30800 [Streptomyces sp. NWU339]|nr:hypothetical protein DIZ27_30800 [Streptomyces sp. NWU339]